MSDQLSVALTLNRPSGLVMLSDISKKYIYILRIYSQVPIYTPGIREASMDKCNAQGHDCHDQESNPHSSDSAIGTWSDAVDRWATTHTSRAMFR